MKKFLSFFIVFKNSMLKKINLGDFEQKIFADKKNVNAKIEKVF